MAIKRLCIQMFLLGALIINCSLTIAKDLRSPLTYYIDSADGKDSNDGLSQETAWQSLARLEQVSLFPNDTVKFKRGSSFTGQFSVSFSGYPDNYIVLTDYGDKENKPAAFTNTQFIPEDNNYGNCIRVRGSYVIVENLYFFNTVAGLTGRIGFETMWELGAVYIDKTARNCIVRNNEFFDCGVAIKSYGENTLISNNYIHDCNRILKEWSWGPIGIWLGADYQEVCNNKIFNYKAIDPRINWGPGSYGGGADGGAIEIDDARVSKSNISIHHNYSKDNQGFIEVTWTDLARNPPYLNFSIHHNISDDYQQFIALWCGAGCRIENNTIIRRKVNENDWGVFNITQNDSKNLIRNNIIIVEKDVVIFNVGRERNAKPNNIIANNLYFAPSGNLNIGLEGPGENPVFGNPEFINYTVETQSGDFSIKNTSPAIDKGLDLGYPVDFAGVTIPQGNFADIGAFESVKPGHIDKIPSESKRKISR